MGGSSVPPVKFRFHRSKGRNHFFVQKWNKFFLTEKALERMAEGEGMGEGGAGAGGMQAAAAVVQNVPDTDTDALHAGGVSGVGGAPVGLAFAFSAEQVQKANVATKAGLADQTTDLNEELLKSQRTVVHKFIEVYATTLATNLAAFVQVICCVHAWLQTLQIVCVCVQRCMPCGERALDYMLHELCIVMCVYVEIAMV